MGDNNLNEISLLRHRLGNITHPVISTCEYDDGTLDVTENEVISYLDFAGAAIPPKILLKSIYDELIKDDSSFLFGNPHSSHNSRNIMKNKTSGSIFNARSLVLKYFNVSDLDYDVIFTSGATASIKLIGESFPWTPDSSFCYPMNSHTSILGNLFPSALYFTIYL